MPFDGSFEWLRELIVQSGAVIGVQVERADDIFSAGMVIEQIKERIRDADLIIAVCTGQNPNVFFELGIADQWHWPILLAEKAADLPFDVQHYRAFLYEGQPRQVLERAIAAAMEGTLQGGKKARPELSPPGEPPRSRPRVLGQFMSQVHVWGLEREGSLEHFPVDVLFLVQDVRDVLAQGRRALASEFPKREGVMANGSAVLLTAERDGLVWKNYDPDSGDWYVVLTQKGDSFVRAYDRWAEELRSGRGTEC